MSVEKTNKPKKDLILLRSLGLDKTTRYFEKQHALRLLRLPKSAWELADETKVFVDNEIKRRKSNRDN